MRRKRTGRRSETRGKRERKERKRERKGRSKIEEGQNKGTMRRDSHAHSSLCRATSYSHSLFIELRPRRIAQSLNVHCVPKFPELEKSTNVCRSVFAI